nr:MAG TPA: tail fiber protein [Caudoviricetes sp.]
MATVSGSLLFVSSRAAQVSEVWLHAREVRTHDRGVVTTGNDRFPVDEGEVSFTALPGPAVLALISQGRAVDTIPIVVGESEAQSLRNVVRAAQVVDDSTQREIERMSAEMMEALDSAREEASAAQGHASTAEGHAAAAGEQVSVARGQAGAAASSAEEAKGHASTAEGHASRAQQSAEESGRSADRAEGARGEARAAWDGAKEARDAAEGHATTAEGHANAASSSASDAEGAAERADESAQQIRDIAESTRWDGDQVTVNGKQSPHLTGPPGDQGPPGPPGTVDGIDFEQYAKVEQLSEFARQETEATFSGIYLAAAEEVNPGIGFQNKGAEARIELSEDNRLVLTNLDKSADRVVSTPDQWDFNTAVDMRNNQLRGLPTPSGDNHAATKAYVDGKADGKQDKAQVLDRLAEYVGDSDLFGSKGVTSTIGDPGAFPHSKHVVVTDDDGWVKAYGEPQKAEHVANKKYVDSQVSAVRDRVGALESGGGGGGFWAGTQAAYNRESKDSNTLYVITG